ncbi:MAG: hypothetical protein Q8P18_15650 [Pseudomonadota bacterium]|nr:hypothetical protein [Pseudomonadota bacterium]
MATLVSVFPFVSVTVELAIVFAVLGRGRECHRLTRRGRCSFSAERHPVGARERREFRAVDLGLDAPSG